MKKLAKLFGVVAALTCGVALAQNAPTVPGASGVQQNGARLDASQLVGTSASTGATITLTALAGQYIYVTGVEITNCAGASAVTAAAVTSVTTTNLGGATWTVGSGATAGLCQPSPAAGLFAMPLKSTIPGTNVTLVLPTFATNQTVRVSAYYYTSNF